MGNLEQKGSVYWIGFWLVPCLAFLGLLSVVIGFLSPDDSMRVAVSEHSILEFLAFFWLGSMAVAAFQLRWVGVLFTFAGGAALSGFFEAAQVWTPFRDAALVDWGLNLAGLGLGVLFGRIVGFFLGHCLAHVES